MPPIEINQQLCNLCELCIKKCPFGALELKDNKIVVNEKCTGCGICVKACPSKAITLLFKPVRKKAVNLDNYRGVWVFIEQSNNCIASVSFELLGEGRKLANKLNVELCAVLLGNNVSGLTQEIASFGADKIYLIDHPVLSHYRTAPYLEAIVHLSKKYNPEIILYGATVMGRDIAGAVATTLETGLTADCTGLDIEENTRNLKQTRPAFGGNIMATIMTKFNRPQMATVRPRIMKSLPKDPNKTAQIIKEEFPLSEENMKSKLIEFIPSTEKTTPIEDAQIIVSGGKGMGGAKNFELLEEFAHRLGGVVAGSRKAVEAGWVPVSSQVGQTGKTVRPKIYFACGISGAIQHLVGMQTADMIVAINKDPNAPIFKIANYGIVGDLFEVIPKLSKELNEIK